MADEEEDVDDEPKTEEPGEKDEDEKKPGPRVPEPPGNLRRREEWFRKRSRG